MHGRKHIFSQWIAAAVVFAACMVPPSVSNAAPGQWTWIGGPNLIAQPGIYGTKGVPDEDNLPGARYSGTYWTDNATGSLWLFSGYGYDSAGIDDYLNDLWRYDPDNDTWTWVNGPDTALQPPVYGTKGVPDAANLPGGRYESVSWMDVEGNLWLFGGFGLDNETEDEFLNDLWRYDTDNDTWTWMGGSAVVNQPGVYGSKGVADADNVPGARYGSVAWTDSSGSLWLFGGYGIDNATREDYLNDLWRYDTSANQWTWISGSVRIAEEGVYGEKGVPDADNIPGARYGSFGWIDSADDLWLFGGFGFDDQYLSLLSDLWRYDTDNGTWTWMSGPDRVAKRGKYGSQGIATEDTVPGARYTGSSWIDVDGNLWLFGGIGFASNRRRDILNDLWRYEPGIDRWTWISGSDRHAKPGVYGTKDVPDAANVPGARDGSIAWTDSDGNLRLFGGYGIDAEKEEDYLNDMLRFELPADSNIRVDTCKVKDGEGDRIRITGWMDIGEDRMSAALGDDIVLSLWSDTVPDPAVTTFRFPINADTLNGHTYTFKEKTDRVLSFSYDGKRGTMKFDAKNVDLTGLRCPITLTIQIGAYLVQAELEEDLVNGSKPCPLSLVMGLLDSLDAEKFKAKKSTAPGSDSVSMSGTFTVDGTFDTGQPVAVTLGPDTFSVPGAQFSLSKGVYSCKNADSGNGSVSAQFDTLKCTFSIKIADASLNGTGDVAFMLDIFGNALQDPDPVSLP